MAPGKLFRDRVDAGCKLARVLERFRDETPVVLGLPRGGVPVAFEVARKLEAPLDVCVVRKVGAPFQPELGLGAVAEGGVLHLDRAETAALGISEADLAPTIEEKRAEVEERVQRFRRGAPPVDVRGRTVIVVDDGVATGGTARAALQTLRARGARRVVLGVPVGSAETLRELARVADDLVCPHPEERLMAIGDFFADFGETTDDDVVEILARSGTGAKKGEASGPADVEVQIPLDGEHLNATLMVPEGAKGHIVFAHGSGSGRRSPRNRQVATELQRAGFATLLVDLLTEREAREDEASGGHRFDIGLLATRLLAVTDWARRESPVKDLPIGYFGASTGAAAALVAAAERQNVVRAVVSRGGRPDLAESSLRRVTAPTLLIVGGADTEVLELNREAAGFLECERRLEVVRGATHLFEEPGALEQVARSASRWFGHHLKKRALDKTA
jgi:putative phosphoribosyl transferase